MDYEQLQTHIHAITLINLSSLCQVDSRVQSVGRAAPEESGCPAGVGDLRPAGCVFLRAAAEAAERRGGGAEQSADG